MFDASHGAKRLWPLPWSVAWGHHNQVHRCHPHTMGDDICAWFGKIPSTSLIVSSVIEGEKTLWVWTVQHQTFGGYIDRDGGVRARIKVPKSAQNIFNNQEGLVGGWRRWGDDLPPTEVAGCPWTTSSSSKDKDFVVRWLLAALDPLT
jgi:hypothetical protein